MGLGGPLGGLVSDRFAVLPYLFGGIISDFPTRFGWRWAFIMQLPLFALSLILTTYNLRYVTPVSTSPDPHTSCFMAFTGEGKERQGCAEKN